MYKWLINYAKRFCKMKVIMDRESKEPYLVRYYIFSTRFLENVIPSLSYKICVHNTLKSDNDGLHDHPWDWWSKILQGGYFEHTQDSDGTPRKTWRSPTSGWRHGKSTDFHRLELDPARPKGQTWSLFIMGPKKKEWGFLSKYGHWVKWDTYINNRDKYN